MSNTASKNNRSPQPIALTPGEPAGIGPDLAILIASQATPASIVCFADPDLMAERAHLLGLNIDIVEIVDPAACHDARNGQLQVFPIRAAARAVPGELDRRNAPYVLDCLSAAIDQCRAGRVAAMVTGPVQKSVINDAGVSFTGHTEYLAERMGAPVPVMMLVSGALRVALVTTHVPVREVPGLVTVERLNAVLEVLYLDLQRLFGIANPRLCVCGLNPHAGEGGHLGDEDRMAIEPAIESRRQRGWAITGPVPADTAFAPANRVEYDAILAMYHDQGLTALKAVGFGSAVNVTLGLPVIRTSVDHGTALDRAGTGKVDIGSLLAAVELASVLAFPRNDHVEQ